MVIRNFRHKGLRQLFEDDNPRGLNPEHVRKIKVILTVMNAAKAIADLDEATFRLHPLVGDLRAVGRLAFVRTGGLSSGSRMVRRLMSISSTIIDWKIAWR